VSSPADTTFERLKTILVSEFEVASELIRPAAKMNELAIDSLAVIEVMFRLEDEFRVSFPQDPGELSTIGDLVDCIDRLTAGKPLQVSTEASAP